APAKITIPNNLLKQNDNHLAIRLANPAKKLQVFGTKDDFYISSSDRFRVHLSDNWNLIENPETIGPSPDTYQSIASYLFNGMVSPVIPFGIKGFIWYQGESNVNRPLLYEKLFADLIKDWRKRWQQGDLPFLFVQLSNIERTHEFHEDNDSWSLLREAQKKALALPETGMVVSIDIGDSLDIHPKNKQVFGHRLALQALKVAYDKPIIADGPTIKTYQIKSDKIILEFNDDLFLKKEKPNNIEVAKEDKIFHKTNFLLNGNKLIMVSPVKNPKFIKYAWQNNPETVIHNEEGLPAAPILLKIE
ncbi:MAG: sialate O-acetylesterase, partial [Cyclobacteriaceae bacterium]